MEQGWTYGPTRDDATLKHPCLVPYEELPEAEKCYDRATALETLKVISSLGFEIVKNRDNSAKVDGFVSCIEKLWEEVISGQREVPIQFKLLVNRAIATTQAVRPTLF